MHLFDLLVREFVDEFGDIRTKASRVAIPMVVYTLAQALPAEYVSKQTAGAHLAPVLFAGVAVPIAM